LSSVFLIFLKKYLKNPKNRKKAYFMGFFRQKTARFLTFDEKNKILS